MEQDVPVLVPPRKVRKTPQTGQPVRGVYFFSAYDQVEYPVDVEVCGVAVFQLLQEEVDVAPAAAFVVIELDGDVDDVLGGQFLSIFFSV